MRNSVFQIIFLVAIVVSVTRIGLKNKTRLMSEDLLPLSYERNIRPIMETRCATCHNATTPGRNWLDYKEAYASRKQIKARIANRSMPASGFPILEYERILLVDWVNQGAKK